MNTGTLAVTNSTLSGNSTNYGGGGISNGGTLEIMTSIFANSDGGDIGIIARNSFVSLGHNLFSDKPAVPLDSTDLINTDPRLGPLADNGGPTFTQALLPDSPAIDGGVAIAGVTTDQGGVPRPQGIAPDIGAFEVRATATIGLTPATANPTGPTQTLTATVLGLDGAPRAGVPVTFQITAGPDAGATGVTEPADGRTDVAGRVRFTYSASDSGTDSVLATARLPERVTIAAPVARVTWFIPPRVVGARRDGIHLYPTRVVVAFDLPMDLASARDVRNYTLVPTGPAGRIGPHPRPIPIASAVYDSAARAVTLAPRHRLALHGYYRLTVSATPPSGLKSAAGVPLDGSGRGVAGSAYVALVHGFGAATQVRSPVGPPR